MIIIMYLIFIKYEYYKRLKFVDHLSYISRQNYTYIIWKYVSSTYILLNFLLFCWIMV